MKTLRALFLLLPAFFVFGISSAISGPYGGLTPWQALDELAFNIKKLNETDAALAKNGDIAEANYRELAGLNEEKTELDVLESDYDNRVATHNADVDEYNETCALSDLDPATYNSCLSWKSTLDYNKRQLDAEASSLDARFADYNQRVSDFNTREDSRALAVEQLVKKYDEYSANIRSLQLHLNALGAVEGLQDFAVRNQDCANRASLEDMHHCMQVIWDGAKK